MPLLLRRRSHLDLPKASHAEDSTNTPPADHESFRDQVNLAVPSTSVRPGSNDHGHHHPHSRLSHEVQPDDISDSQSISQSRRFSIMRFRNLSESHLAGRSKQEAAPPLPTMANERNHVPSILKTAPTMEGRRHEALRGEDPRTERPPRFTRTSSNRSKSEQKNTRKSMDERRSEKKSASLRWRRSRHDGLDDLQRLSALHLTGSHVSPPAYGDESNSALAVPVPPFAKPRNSESSQSEGSNASSGDGPIYGATTTTTHTISTHTTFFKLPGRNKNRNSLFPLPFKPPHPPHGEASSDPSTPRPPDKAPLQRSFTPDPHSPPTTVLQAGTLRRRYTETSPTKRRPHHQHPPIPSPQAALAKGALSFAEPGMNLFRNTSTRSQSSGRSSPLQPPLHTRDRASTTSSFGRQSDVDTLPPASAGGRNSTSTTGRSSFGTLLHFSRFRQSSEPYSPRHGSPGTRSKSNSFAMSREALVVPEREEGDNPGKYLERLEAAVSRSLIAGILSKSPDPFAQSVLRSYTRRFAFFTEPIDMSLRKLLLEAELPKETQQVDRVIEAFADRYHECNPGIFTKPGDAYFIAFSIMMLHTDAFNKNNKHKMQKADYIKNTSGQGISDDVLACFYDNICYTPFVHFEEEVDINGERVMPFTTKKSTAKLKSAIPGSDVVAKRPSGPVDPYNLLVDQKLDQLRPSIKDSITMDDPYNYIGGQGELDHLKLQRAFTHTGVLQIISARSRPAAYERREGNDNPDPTDTQHGIVDLKITKVGTLWRKAARRRKARSPWQEWGAILTGSQLYLFKNAHWAKGLLHQFTSQQKPGFPRIPVIFKPPLLEFKPDALIKTDNAVALIDATYTRHKNAFTFVRPGGQEEVLLASDDSELRDWLGLINYAAAFRAAGVRIRGMLGGNEEDPRKDVRRLNSASSAHSIQTRMGEVTIHNRGLSPQLHRQVMDARRQIMVQKAEELEKDFIDANRQLEGMLRNARHLLVLAPIAQRTREDLIHAAAKADANIKWLRRDIWRMKCHRDILVQDASLDGVSAPDLNKLTQGQAEKQPEPESVKKEKKGMLARLQSSKAQKSPPRSPTTEQPIASGSGDTLFHTDVFRTPPESAVQQQGGPEPWRLPPVTFNPLEQTQHRPSITSTLLSASPSQARHSMSYASSNSSMLQVERVESVSHSDVPSKEGEGRLTPVPTMEEKELQMLARSTITPEPVESRNMNLDGAPQANTPDHKQRSSVRRSLQKTLREAHHHSGHTHRHRRGKDSDSTVRSATAANAADEREPEQGTPGLARDNPRFILHGKQASVVQFGGDWERMKLRREQYARDHAASPSSSSATATAHPWQEPANSAYTPSRFERPGATSPVIQDLSRSPGYDSPDDDDDDIHFDARSYTSAGSRSFREDAEAAEALARGVSPVTSDDKRVTVIGPSPPQVGTSASASGSATADWVQQHRTFSGLEKGEDGTVRLVEPDDDDDDDDDRDVGRSGVTGTARTPILGSPVKFHDSRSRDAARTGSVSAGAEAERGLHAEAEDEENSAHRPIADEDLRRLSGMPAIPGSW